MAKTKKRNIGKILADTRIFFYSLLWLMFLLVTGTIAQKYIGLYQAQHKYFSSFILWFGFLPLPGGYITMGLITTNLSCKLFFSSQWKKSHIGIIITHIGALLLLLGGFITAITSSEGNMVIVEGGSADFISDYYVHELIVVDRQSNEEVLHVEDGELGQGKSFQLGKSDVSFVLKKYYRNSAIVKDEEGKNILKEVPAGLEEESNSAGTVIAFSNSLGELILHDNLTDFVDANILGKDYGFSLRHKQTKLPFSIELLDFEKDVYPGTNTPRSYSSDVKLTHGDSVWESTISMNQPLRYKGYTFYQSSFMQWGMGQEATVLAVVKNAGRMFPYISSIVMCVGLLIHLMIKIPKLFKNKSAAILLAATLFSSSPALATYQDMDYSEFAKIPILHEGRVKPLDTFARVNLQLFSGKTSLRDMSAIQWLAAVVFDSDMANEIAIFKIHNPDVQSFFGLEKKEKNLYSYREILRPVMMRFKELKSIYDMEKSQRSLAQEQALDLYIEFNNYMQIMHSLSLVLPDFILFSKDAADKMDMKTNVKFSYLDIVKHMEMLGSKLQAIAKKKDVALTDLSEEEQQYLTLMYQMKLFDDDRRTTILRIIPPQWEQDSDEWFSPWQTLEEGHGSPTSAAYMEQWKELASAYRVGDVQKWNEVSSNILVNANNMAGGYVDVERIGLEIIYNKADFFFYSNILYVATFLIIMLYALWNRRYLYRLAYLLFSAGFVVHLTGLIIRMIIMSRPPVSTLYESIIFVGLVVVILSLIFETKRRNVIGMLVGAFVGSVLHFLSYGYADDGDTMGMLQAVLDTNFWLATHVVTITIGYGCCLMAGTLGHIYIFMRLFFKKHSYHLKTLSKNMFGVALVALFFTTLGTILGGIWADQSWGRFWGWDPKENGAMLIALWLMWVVHGRHADIIKQDGFAIAMVVTNIVVALAWFGVNLLNVGLHSYGFTEKIASNLAIFCGVEIFIASLPYLIGLNKKRKSS